MRLGEAVLEVSLELWSAVAAAAVLLQSLDKRWHTLTNVHVTADGLQSKNIIGDARQHACKVRQASFMHSRRIRDRQAVGRIFAEVVDDACCTFAQRERPSRIS